MLTAASQPTNLAPICLCAALAACAGDGYAAFSPVKALALDLFPHTHHVEAVVLMERQ